MIENEQPLEGTIPKTSKIIHTSRDTIKNIECSSASLYVNQSKVHGIGVFANKSFQAQEILEVFPIIPLAYRTMYQGDYRMLEYCVMRQCECEECKRHGLVLFLRLGYGGIYNHQDDHNAEIIMDYPNKVGKCRAIKAIEKNQEIFINYGLSYQFREGKNILKEE